GIGEFLPISSSGHLVVFGKLLGYQGESALLNVVLHVGTLGSILVVYRRDLRFVLRDFRLCALIVLASIPAGVVGVLFKDKLEETFDQPLLVACGWLMTASALWFGQQRSSNNRQLSTITARDAGVVGLFQLASLIIRGFSRSGSTIAAGM